jgi:hypothetical protein
MAYSSGHKFYHQYLNDQKAWCNLPDVFELTLFTRTFFYEY